MFCALIAFGVDTSAFAKKHSKNKADVSSVTNDSIQNGVIASTPSTSSNNDAGKILGMSILAFIFLLWVLPSVIPAIIASSKGRSGLGIFILSIFFSPLIGLIVALLMQSAKKQS